jgi:hypothetical protein
MPRPAPPVGAFEPKDNKYIPGNLVWVYTSGGFCILLSERVGAERVREMEAGIYHEQSGLK